VSGRVGILGSAVANETLTDASALTPVMNFFLVECIVVNDCLPIILQSSYFFLKQRKANFCMSKTVKPSSKRLSFLRPSVKFLAFSLNLARFAAYGEHPRRNEILTDFIRIKLKKLLYSATGRSPQTFFFLGREMVFASPDTFTFLVVELFIEETYKGFGPPPEVILDLGSNIGMSILLFKSLWPTCKILGVEASPETFALLQQNVRNLPDVKVVNRAVSDRSGELTFYSTPGSLIGSTNPARGGDKGTVVETVPLSEFITGPVDLLKIDIEGSEIPAFAELEASGKMRLIDRMLIEYHHHVQGESQGLAAFIERLERNGFEYDLSASLPRDVGGMQDVLIRAVRSNTVLQ
jgi:FkbM family methyltransferase